MSRIRQLAMQWNQIATDDARDAKRYAATPTGDTLLMQAVVRRNCAFELMKALDALEKENPTEAGSLPPLNADSESA